MVSPAGEPLRFEADVKQAGQKVETLTGPTREAVTQELKQKYG